MCGQNAPFQGRGAAVLGVGLEPPSAQQLVGHPLLAFCSLYLQHFQRQASRSKQGRWSLQKVPQKDSRAGV